MPSRQPSRPSQASLFVTLTLCQSPFLFSAYALASLLVASYSSPGDLPFHLIHGSYFSLDPSLVMPLHRRLHVAASCRMFVVASFHIISDLTCSLSHAKPSSAHNRIVPFKHSNFTSWPTAEGLTLLQN